jgi:hypothetical protein
MGGIGDQRSGQGLARVSCGCTRVTGNSEVIYTEGEPAGNISSRPKSYELG